MKLRTEGKFNDRISKIRNQDSRFAQIVKKYIPQIKNHFEDLKELHDIAYDDDFRELRNIDQEVWSTAKYDEYIGFPNGSPKLFGCVNQIGYENMGVFVNVIEGTIVFGGYRNSCLICDHFDTWCEYKLDDIESISKDKNAETCSEEGELIKDLVQKHIPNYLSYADKILSKYEKDV